MFAPINGFAGPQPFNDWFLPDTTQRHALGTVIPAVDSYWGYGEFIYLKSNDVILKGSIVRWDNLGVATLFPNTANLGQCIAVAMAPAAANTYFWAQVSGTSVYKTNATVAADAAIGVAAAGILGTNAAGKQVLGCRNMVGATGTTAKTNVQTTNGSAFLRVPGGYDGWYLGIALTGTGVPASTVVARLDPDGVTVAMGSAIGTVDKLATATGAVTVTGTHTGYGIGVINHPFVQGAIT